MIQTWRFDTDFQTLVLGSDEGKLPSVIYWGVRLPDSENLEHIFHAYMIDVTGGMLDENPDLSICPEVIRTFPGQAGSQVRSIGGALLSTMFLYENETFDGQCLTLFYQDKQYGLSYGASFEVIKDSNVIKIQSRLLSQQAVYVNWLAAPVMPASQSSVEMVDFSGRWCGEFQEQRTKWSAGQRTRENHTGRTGHEHFPGLIVPDHGATNTAGNVYGFHYAWSGGHKMIAEELPDGRRQIQFGHATAIEHRARNELKTAPLYLSFSNQGINGVARSFQRLVRRHIVDFPESKRPRPVHYNCWEAVYFDHNESELKEIATLASELGAERFVLDDGWFGTRDDDTQALSEWEVDPRKYPNGLQPLIEHVHSQGMSFGLWFEPEMINPKSSVYCENPQWALGIEDQMLGRNQKVLNMALTEVRAFLFKKIANILNDYDIDYIKWDHNRVLPVSDAAQTRGTYELLDLLRKAYPNVEIESCASGGGRIDYGILSRSHRVWLSDSNDALERARIQHGAAIFLPACVTGSHVGPRLCHTSGRVHDIHFRAWVAAQRHLGFEMDPRELTTDEVEVLSKVCCWWKNERCWLMKADIFRLDSSDKAVIAEQHMSEDQSQFIIFANKIDTSTQIAPRPIRAYDLDANAEYEIDLVNRDEIHRLSRGKVLIKQQKMRFSGSYLMNYGLTLPWSFPGQVWVLKGIKL